MLRIPTRQTAEDLLTEAARRNPGPWVAHARVAGQAAQAIAAHLPGMDAPAAGILGLLHDIGRRAGPGNLSHMLHGYRYLESLGYPDAARICLTHSFPLPDVHATAGELDGPAEDLHFLEDFLSQVAYTPYDRLIQLCDCLALPAGFCLLEKRFVDVTLRYGFRDLTLARWQAFLQIKAEFDEQAGGSIYRWLPGIEETTFGVDLNGNEI